MSRAATPHEHAPDTRRIVYRPYAFDPPANPMGNKMDTPFGNPDFDARIIQIDAAYRAYTDNYDAVRTGGHFDAYVAEDRLDPRVRTAVCAFLLDALCAEYPDAFRRDASPAGAMLYNTLLDETIRFDAALNYEGGGRFDYNDALDALAAQIPEDLAIVHVAGVRDRLAAVHVVAPSGWAPREKLGGSFVDVHHPIQHHRSWLEKVHAGVRNMAKADRPLQRFGWSLTNDANLNHHPQYGGPSGASRVRGGRDLYVRVERQILKGFPEHAALLFTIRVYVERCADLPPADRAALKHAVEAMGPEERKYKGVHGDFERVVAQLGE